MIAIVHYIDQKRENSDGKDNWLQFNFLPFALLPSLFEFVALSVLL